MTPSVGRWTLIVLALWLMLVGAIQALSLTFNYMHVILGVMLILMGVFILLGK